MATHYDVLAPFSVEIRPLFAWLALSPPLTALCLSRLSKSKRDEPEISSFVKSFLLFFYPTFIKSHQGDAECNQQDALESFYKMQACAYDATRKLLLRGREEMLALVAAQLESRNETTEAATRSRTERIWVDIGGGTGWNIEAMAKFVHVPTFFSRIYLVDLSPSLCDVARRRFARLGWENVTVVCEDARQFRLDKYEAGANKDGGMGLNATQTPALGNVEKQRLGHGGADLVTLSYSLSMIPDYYAAIDSVASLLAPHGLVAAVDFYVQNGIDYSFRNYTGGALRRHVNALSRIFWRAWFEFDRVGLEPARRDYLEYKFGTIASLNCRNRQLGYVPFYLWLGCRKKPFSPSSLAHEIVQRIDALATESPCLYPLNQPINQGVALTRGVPRSAAPEIRSKGFVCAVKNLSANVPLPSCYYQNHHWRIYYDDQLRKHTQFNNQYIYAFTWEDARVDERLLKLGPDDKVLAIGSAGDNIFSYLAQGPARVHAVDVNPTQNHLLELKAASYTVLSYEDFWMLFGHGKHPNFRHLLLTKLSSHLSSRALQFWFDNVHVFQNADGHGLYGTGGSRHALRLVRWLLQLFGLQNEVVRLLEAKTLNEQREIWRQKIRPVLLSKLVCKLIVSQQSFLWNALGVPKNQLDIIEADHARSSLAKGEKLPGKSCRSRAVWHYMVNTLDPVAEETHISSDNPYYYVCLAGKFSLKCPPEYLRPETHAKLSRPRALDGLRIHTDELEEVIARISPETLTVAVVMDSMDWLDAGSQAAVQQVRKLNRALKTGGRVLLRSSALSPWYIGVFESNGFTAKRHAGRLEGECIDRVNMYASCWMCTKGEHLPPPSPPPPHIDRTVAPKLRV
ncbi:hypothetical protein DCS_03757 [Drechmeria coniospora]|uniref:Betaine lipid synthase n=1 Tax=Drechmeria coniospora TaxID=98403 RepID=A0A151GI81_DRECN|nr:hypothetical protein DCS_03757 [Drechmeria coniospora]KYK56751.1 hypothetical protein DCS_03757 [Drechmeria coniospora]